MTLIPLSFHQYIQQAQHFILHSGRDSEAVQKLIKLVMEKLDEPALPSQYIPFFKGELAFFHGKYAEALEYYSKAADIPNISFFELRAKAFLSHSMQQEKQAILFCQGAIELFPYDFLVINLIHTLYRQSLDYENAAIFQEILQNLNSLEALPPLEEWFFKKEEKVEEANFSESSFSLDESEIQDFDQIFRSYAEDFVGEESVAPPLNEEPVSPSIPSFDLDFMDSAPELEESYADEEQLLEKRVETFQTRQSRLMEDYTLLSSQETRIAENALYILNGWTFAQAWGHTTHRDAGKQIPSVLLPEYYRKTAGGYYLRWNNKGIVINPGMNFLQAFHQHKLYITDIDYVIITRDAIDTYADVKGIYDLNYQHNCIRNDTLTPHVINYYLNQEVHRNLSATLKPHFKQERHMLHCLELYLDSPDEEMISLSEDIQLCYFQGNDSRDGKKRDTNALGIRLNLYPCESGSKARSLGFISGMSWARHYVAPLQDVDLLIAGFEKTSPDDYNKLHYQSDCLGYYGVYSLLTRAQPKLLLCCEFDGKDGDIRLEAIKKMRKDVLLNQDNYSGSMILPGDMGMYLDLDQLQIQCSVCEENVSPHQIHVVKSKESFGALNYICQNCTLS